MHRRRAQKPPDPLWQRVNVVLRRSQRWASDMALEVERAHVGHSPLIRLWYDERMGYQELLHHYPPAEIVEESDPEYPLFKADGGCRVLPRANRARIVF